LSGLRRTALGDQRRPASVDKAWEIDPSRRSARATEQTELPKGSQTANIKSRNLSGSNSESMEKEECGRPHRSEVGREGACWTVLLFSCYLGNCGMCDKEYRLISSSRSSCRCFDKAKRLAGPECRSDALAGAIRPEVGRDKDPFEVDARFSAYRITSPASKEQCIIEGRSAAVSCH
jgi:hypothetical protein